MDQLVKNKAPLHIAIVGTRGIPNRYGGFEQFTSFIAPMLTEKGYIVSVYNPTSHTYKEKQWKGVELIRKYDAHDLAATAGQFIYDLLCILDTRKRKPDIIIQLGYTSSSIWGFLLPKDSLVITSTDGMEWKRNKYGFLAKRFLRRAEKLAIHHSDALVADSVAIQQYLYETYRRMAYFIPYGAMIFEDPDPEIIGNYGLLPFEYNLVIARCVPENHLEMIIQGCLGSSTGKKLVIIGMDKSTHAKYLLKTYHNPKIIFKQKEYDIQLLNNLRYYSNLYFHGHSAGGTNPSLLEAMACSCLIAAHHNVFNWEVLGHCAYYFDDAKDISLLLAQNPDRKQHKEFLKNNLLKIEQQYNWQNVCSRIEQLIQAHYEGDSDKFHG